MALQLNQELIPYKEFSGDATGHSSTLEQMHALRAEGRVPAFAAALMDRKLEVRSARYSAEVRAAWHDNTFDTADGFFSHPDGKIKVVPDAKVMWEINSESKLSNGAYVLPDGAYGAAQGAEFTKEELKKIIKNSYTRDEAKFNPLLQVLAREQHRLNAFVDFVYDETKRRFEYDQNMGIYVGPAQKVPTGRLFYIDGLRARSFAHGGAHLDGIIGRLIG